MQSTEADSKYSAFVLFFTLSTYPSLDSTFAVTTTSVLTWRELIKIQLKDRIGFRTFILYKEAGIWYNQQKECSIVCSFLSTFVPEMFTFNIVKVYMDVLKYSKTLSKNSLHPWFSNIRNNVKITINKENVIRFNRRHHFYDCQKSGSFICHSKCGMELIPTRTGVYPILPFASYPYEEAIQAIWSGCVHYIRNCFRSWLYVSDLLQLVQFHQPIHWT